MNFGFLRAWLEKPYQRVFVSHTFERCFAAAQSGDKGKCPLEFGSDIGPRKLSKSKAVTEA